MTWWPFILELEARNKYWVGLYKKPTKELSILIHHAQLQGCQGWFKKWGNPINFKQEAIHSQSEFLSFLFKIMFKYGIDNVRGGPFVKIMLDNSEIQIIDNCINYNENRCVKCGSKNHITPECSAKTTVDDFELSDIEPSYDTDTDFLGDDESINGEN
jgi:hypothetical protein